MQVVESPSLRDYQKEDIARAAEAGRVILGHEMGLGKTAITLHALQRLTQGDVLVIGPKVALGVWEAEIAKWLGEEATIWVGPPSRREKLWQNRERFVVTNYALADRILALKPLWSAIVLDEAHIIRNRKTKTFKTVKRFRSRYLFLLTGTPVVSGPANLWTLLNLIQPERWGSYWSFVNRYCYIVNNGFGWQVLGPKNPQALNAAISPYLIRRRKADVMLELPPKVRQLVPVEMTSVQRSLYDQMAREMVAIINEESIKAPNVVAKITRLRQISVSPRLLGHPEPGAMYEAVLEQLGLEFEAGNSVVVFSPFAKALDAIRPEVEKLADKVVTIVGGLPQKEVTARVAEFQSAEGRKAMLATVTLGVGWSATAANVAMFLGYDWTPAVNIQAEDRLHRVGQQNSVRVLYFGSKGTIDQYILSILRRKTTWSKLSLEPEKLLQPDSNLTIA